MYFLGVDLAWSKQNSFAYCLLKEKENKQLELLDIQIVADFDEFYSYLSTSITKLPSLTIAIDAPLEVTNETGNRLAEQELTKVYRKFHAGCHPINLNLLQRYQSREFLANFYETYLAPLGISLACEQKSDFQVIETYPHAAMIDIFSLTSRIPYKAKAKRTKSQRLEGFTLYQQHLLKFNISDTRELLTQDLFELTLKSLKNYEDKLDSLFCAYLAYLYKKEPENSQEFGEGKEKIILPKL